MGVAWLAGMKAGALPDQDEFARQWALDREFRPAMSDDVRDAKYAAWKRAVDSTLRF